MNVSTYCTLYAIIADLTDADLVGFLSDCAMSGAKKTKSYVSRCLHSGEAFDRSVAKLALSEDFSGV